MLRKGMYLLFRKQFVPRIKRCKFFERMFPLVRGDIGGQSRIHTFLAKQALNDSDYEIYPRPGGSIVDEDWDNLIILDACRYDLYNEMFGCEKRISRGTTTSEWLRMNFKDFYDITYISSNPHISDRKLDDFRGTDHFSHVENVWDHGWNYELNTVLPEKITKSAIELNESSDGRMIIHYMQPHQPFVGDYRLDYPGKDNPAKTVFDAFVLGEISREDMWKAYRSNLRYVKVEIDRLLDNLEGTTVLTADHGNAFGPLFYAHPPGIRIRELVEVPLKIFKG
ncbi:MAG: hypothetical protein ABEK36_03905 [Candidatus Aenigmatarchaeota archaeon]